MQHTILIVDDDAHVLDVFGILLSKSGHQVLKASNGQHAMQVWKNHAGRIDLLVTDVFMPDMTGIELASALSVLQPELKVVFTTGASQDSVEALSPNPAKIKVLKKTTSAEDLREAVRQALAGG